MGESGRCNAGSPSVSHPGTGFILGTWHILRYRRTVARAEFLTVPPGSERAVRYGIKSSPRERSSRKEGLMGSPRSAQRRMDSRIACCNGSEETAGRASMAGGRNRFMSFFNPRYSR